MTSKDRCEVCGQVLAERPVATRRRCRDHLDQRALFPLAHARPTASRARKGER